MSDLTTIIAQAIRMRPEEISDELAMEAVDSWDSLAHMDLVAGIESTYGIDLTADDIVAMTRVGAIREVLAKKGVE